MAKLQAPFQIPEFNPGQSYKHAHPMRQDHYQALEQDQVNQHVTQDLHLNLQQAPSPTFNNHLPVYQHQVTSPNGQPNFQPQRQSSLQQY